MGSFMNQNNEKSIPISNYRSSLMCSCEDRTNNYIFKYVVKDLSVGSHKLTSRASYQEGGASSSTTASYTINIIE